MESVKLANEFLLVGSCFGPFLYIKWIFMFQSASAKFVNDVNNN